VEIFEADASGQPFGQRILIQCLVRGQQRFPVLPGDDLERVYVLALTPAFRNQCIGDSLADQAVRNQHAKKLGQGQFVFMRSQLLHV